MSIQVSELKQWLATLTDSDYVGIDDGGMMLQTEDGRASIDVGGIPESDAE